MELILIAALLIMGIWGMVRKENLVKKVISLSIFNASVIMLFVYTGSLEGQEAPILLKGVKEVVDPLPQALMLTAIVIGICITALALAIVVKIYERFASLSIRTIEAALREEHE